MKIDVPVSLLLTLVNVACIVCFDMISRWQFMVLTIAVLSAAICNGDENDYDTIVIGLGAAGTVAASTLARAGKKVLALEAQDRIGGRVWTMPFGDGVVEVGAEWIFGQYPSRVYDTAIENNITVLNQGDNVEILKSDGNAADSVSTELVTKWINLEEYDHDKPQPLGEYITKKIHGTEDSRTYNTAINNSVSLLVQDTLLTVIQSDGRPASADVSDILKKSLEFAEIKVDKTVGLGDSLTKKLMDYMKENTPDVLKDQDLVTQILELVNLMVSNYEAADDWNDVNAADNSETLGGNLHTSWHRHGYKTFFELMLNKYKDGPGLPSLHIKLNTEVTKIEWPQESGSQVSVTVKDGKVYKANNVIVTVSLGVLKAKYKSIFSPALPQEKITAIEKIQMGKIGKIIFSFPNAWWSKTLWYGFLWKADDVKKVNSEDEWIKKIVGVSFPMGSSNTITMWTCGEGTKQVEILPEETVKVKALGLLRQFMGANVTIPEPTGMIRSKWFSNEFTRGAYTYESMIAAPYPTARNDLAASLKDSAGKPRVLFAGEATHCTRFGTVHGAADTGHREAMRLLDTKQE